MHASEFSVMRACEDTHWWYVGLHEITLDFINQLAVPGDNSQFLDAGCGTGGFIEKCSNSHPEIVGMEPSEFAFNELKSRETELLARADLLRSPFPDNSFEIVLSHDVIGLFSGEQLKLGVKQLCRMVRPGGFLILNLPAFQWLISSHDKFVGNKTRFQRDLIKALLEAEGMEIQTSTYRLFFLFPLVAASRLIDRCRNRGEVTHSDVRMPNAMVNRILLWTLRMENRLIRKGIRFPWGLSIFVIARKKAETNHG